jgi:hypothetical protein
LLTAASGPFIYAWRINALAMLRDDPIGVKRPSSRRGLFPNDERHTHPDHKKFSAGKLDAAIAAVARCRLPVPTYWPWRLGYFRWRHWS